ncbi:NADH-quinone oxidoreductase subunit L, partial [Thioclava sp. BHET1]
YGGLRKKIPFTFWMMMIGTLAITGVGIPFSTDLFGIPIGFAGFQSKDAIIEATYAGGSMYSYWLLVIAAAFTAFYSWRLMFLTFWGKPRGDHHAHDHAHESPLVMLIPLGLLAIGATFAGMLGYNAFFGNETTLVHFFGLHEGARMPGQGSIYIAPDNHVLETAHHLPEWVGLAPTIAMALGFLIALQMYIFSTDLPGKLANSMRPLYLFLLNKWYFDELYDLIIVRPALGLGRVLWKKGDGAAIDGAVNGFAMGVIPFFTRLISRAQSGYLFHYAFAMVVGIAVLMTWMSLTGGSF